MPNKEEVIAFIEGIEATEPCVTLRLNNLKKGEYYVLYRGDFKKEHLVRRLNLVFYSEFSPKMSETQRLKIQQREEFFTKF